MFTEANVSKKNAQKKWIRLFPREYLDLFGSNWKLAWQVFASSKAANDASTAASATFFVWAWRGEADWSEAGLSGLSLKRCESVLGKKCRIIFQADLVKPTMASPKTPTHRLPTEQRHSASRIRSMRTFMVTSEAHQVRTAHACDGWGRGN